MVSSYYNITFFNPLLFSKLILKFINLLVDTKSPHYFCVLHILSNLFFTMLLICQVTKIRTDGFMYYICMGIGSILICKHDFTVYCPSSSILRIFNYQFSYFHKLFNNQIWKALNHTVCIMKFCSKDILHFLTFTRLTLHEFHIIFACLILV